MTDGLTLSITTNEGARRAEIRLLDVGGAQLAFHSVDFSAIPVGTRNALFDLRKYLRFYVDPQEHETEMARVGVAIAEKVLGKDIFVRLWPSHASRTLRIVLPRADAAQNELAVGIARIPWEIARPAMGRETLAERNLRLVHQVSEREPASQALPIREGEELRVLFVFADAKGIHPLGMRQERRELTELFAREIYPKRKVLAHFLGHGVTRAQLLEQVRAHKGYHAVHWSGHGATNTLVMCKPGGEEDRISGGELIQVFKEAGGHLPRLFVLSACHSGNVGDSITFSEFLARVLGRGGPSREALPKDLEFEREPSFVGTAHALLQGGVPAVVAMRFSVSDDYARELARLLYKFLLADPGNKAVDEALMLARAQLLRDKSGRFPTGDHATPLLYGGEPPFQLAGGRSSALADGRRRRLHDIGELRMAQHPGFVGRTWELAGLGSDFIGTAQGFEVKPVAMISGLVGMGKTAIVAEALELWEDRFDWVLIYQGKPNALTFDATFRGIHLDLLGEDGIYAKHVTEHRSDAIWRAATTEFHGEERHRRLVSNLVRAMAQEKILLVLDNFETALKPHAEGDSEQLWACQEPAWDYCFSELATNLEGTGSRVLVTTRQPLASLAKKAYCVVLGPLTEGEAALFLRQHPVLSRMLFGSSNEECALVYRLLHASRFHPLLMDRLARLFVAELRSQLLAALESLEKQKGYADLPELLNGSHRGATENDYLRDALESSIDLLIFEAGPDSRLLLWIVSLMNQPEALGLLRAVWEGQESAQMQQLRQLKSLLDNQNSLPRDLREKFETMPLDLRVRIADQPPIPRQRRDLEAHLQRLVRIGLVTEEYMNGDKENATVACHDLVRERIWVFMDRHPKERGDLTADSVRLSFVDFLADTFEQLLPHNGELALSAGSRALVYCVDSMAWNQLGDLASSVINSTRGPRLINVLLPHLQKAAELAPEGWPRWSCKAYLADALRQGGHAAASLPFYEEAASAAFMVAENGGAGADQALIDYGAIAGNWAGALLQVGQLPAARERTLESAKALRRVGRPAVEVLARELEAARISVIEGRPEQVDEFIDTAVQQIAGWWHRGTLGENVPEAPDSKFLAVALIGALNIAAEAHFARENWSAALAPITMTLKVMQKLGRPAEDIAWARANLGSLLLQLRRFGEAKTELEACLPALAGDHASIAKVLGCLADLLGQQGDFGQAITQQRRALGLRESLPDPADRASSHNNLANYLENRGEAADLAESQLHQLASLAYRLAAGLGQDLKFSVQGYSIRFREARDAGKDLQVPRLAELLAEPAFSPLSEWLARRGVDLFELQDEIDAWLLRVRGESGGQLRLESSTEA